MEPKTSQSKKIYIVAILLAPLVIAFLYPLIPVSGFNSDIMWRFNLMLAKGYWQFFIALMIYLVIVYLALRIFRSFR